MPQAEEVAAWRGRPVVDEAGEKIGTLEEIYLDEDTGQPEWALVKTGLLAGKSPFVPLAGASADDEAVRVRFAKDQVKDAPSIKADEQLLQKHEAALYAHYGLEYSFVPSGSGMPEGEPEAADAPGAAKGADAAAAGAPTGAPGQAADPDTPRGTSDAAPAAAAGATGAAASGGDWSTAGDSEGGAGAQDVRVRARSQPRERVRLRKYVVTDHVTRTVPVQREEVRVEREPADGDAPAAAGDGAQELTLNQEEAVIEQQSTRRNHSSD